MSLNTSLHNGTAVLDVPAGIKPRDQMAVVAAICEQQLTDSMVWTTKERKVLELIRDYAQRLADV